MFPPIIFPSQHALTFLVLAAFVVLVSWNERTAPGCMWMGVLQ